MSAEERKGKSPDNIKVIDRRLFNKKGERIRDREPETQSEELDSLASAPKTEPGANERATFEGLVFSLSSSAFVSLGEVENPLTRERTLDLDAAKHAIDMLAVLQEKTQGNLDPQEERVIDSILYELRMSYLNKQEEGDG